MSILQQRMPLRALLAGAMVFLTVISGPDLGAAQEQGKARRIIDALQDWGAQNAVARVHVAATYRGVPQISQGFGAADGPLAIASLSKAITAACLSELVALDLLDWRARVRLYLPDAKEPLAQMRLADLITHTSGLAPDETQGAMPAWRGAGEPVYDRVVANLETREAGAKSFFYNNENYAVLAKVIRAVSGKPYVQTCRELVLVPAGAQSAVPSADYGRFAAWGGWQMTLSDYTRVAWHIFHGSDPAALPEVDFGNGVHYGLGSFWRPFQGGHNFWHFGALCFDDSPGFTSFSALYANGWGVAVWVQGCPQDGWFLSLDQAVVNAVFK